MKYQTTEKMRRAVNDAMDIHGGRGICDGPRNYLQSAYQMVPVGITVEGANILTRTLIIFGQARCAAIPISIRKCRRRRTPTANVGSTPFEARLRQPHRIFAFERDRRLRPQRDRRSARLGARSRAAHVHWYRQLARASRSFAFVADLTVALLGGGLKTKQKITGRMADALSELYMLAATLKRYDDDGRPAGDEHIVTLAAKNALHRFQEAIGGTIDNFPAHWARPLMRAVVFPLGRRFKPASDALGHKSRARSAAG